MDSFQGRERNIIILSCVRADMEAGIGTLRSLAGFSGVLVMNCVVVLLRP